MRNWLMAFLFLLAVSLLPPVSPTPSLHVFHVSDRYGLLGHRADKTHCVFPNTRRPAYGKHAHVHEHTYVVSLTASFRESGRYTTQQIQCAQTSAETHRDTFLCNTSTTLIPFSSSSLPLPLCSSNCSIILAISKRHFHPTSSLNHF